MSADVATSLQHVVPATVRFSPEFRQHHLGASQWPAAVGYDPYQEPIELFGRLTGVMEWDDTESDASELGHALEDGLRKLAAKRLGLQVVPCQTLVHPRHPWAVATPDGLCEDGSLIQVKTTGLANDGEPAEAEEWGSDEGDVPARVLTQVMGEMTVTRAWKMVHAPTAPETREVHVAVLLGGRARGFRLYRVEWDEELARRLFDRVARFWMAVQSGTVPEPRDTEAFYKYLTARYPKHEAKKWVDADEGIAHNVAGWAQIDAQIKALKAQRHAAQNAVCMRIGDAEGVRGGTGDASWRLPWRYCNGKKSLDQEALKQHLAALLGSAAKADELLERCVKQGNGYRKLGPMWRADAPKKTKKARAA